MHLKNIAWCRGCKYKYKAVQVTSTSYKLQVTSTSYIVQAQVQRTTIASYYYYYYYGGREDDVVEPLTSNNIGNIN